MVREAEHAESTSDFIHKLSIVLKEANESDYWYDLLFKGGYIDETSFNSIKTDLLEILKRLVSIV